MSDLLRRALATDYGWMALGNERFEADGATFICNPSVPLIRERTSMPVRALLSEATTPAAE
jgi:hypothetical protein